jgi:hypothetical protein
METRFPLPVVRVISSRVAEQDRLWSEPLDAARLWKSQGAPDREIAWMLAVEFLFVLTEDDVRKLLNGYAHGRQRLPTSTTRPSITGPSA